MKNTPEFVWLRDEATAALVDFADGANFEDVLARLAIIGEQMSILLG